MIADLTRQNGDNSKEDSILVREKRSCEAPKGQHEWSKEYKENMAKDELGQNPWQTTKGFKFYAKNNGNPLGVE